MTKIIHLPTHVISRIAAGEVIESPLYAVKELIENSLDAHAQSIVIQIERGGLQSISVTDDGYGMEKDDLNQSFKSHTTSKFFDETLVGIPTLGFRGEALASLSAVSTLTLSSRTKDMSGGYFITVKEGDVIDEGHVGMPIGTRIVVEDLFSSIPARKKFLKPERIEFMSITDLVMRYAIAYPTIRFLLLHNNKPVLDLMKEKTLQSRISSLFKKDIVQNLMQFDDQDEYMQLQGFIAHPQFSTASQSKQYIMVNNRPVFDKSLSTIVKKAYSGLLANNRYPIFVLSITLPHEAVDVNVHPRKEAVSFMSRDSVNDFITNTIKKTLGNHDLRHGLPLASTMQYRTGSTHSETADMLKESSALWNVKDEKEQLSVESIQQFHKTYLVCTTSKNVVIIDQHAAHERILYEQLITTYKKHSHKNIELENDFLLDISDNEAEILQMNKDMLLQSGFKFIKKGEEWYLREVPVLFKKRDFNLLIHELLDNVHETDSVSIDSITHTMITYLACRNAVKAGDILTEKEAKRLVEKLAVTKNNTTCPHGRPTTIKLLSQDLAKWFGRS